LFDDEVVCLVSEEHPAVRRGWDAAAWLAADHVAPGQTHPGAKGVIDEHLDSLGLQRNITARVRAFQPDPGHGGVHAAGADHRARVLRAFLHGRLPVVILPCPVPFPA
jgi:hypothetical protein